MINIQIGVKYMKKIWISRLTLYWRHWFNIENLVVAQHLDIITKNNERS